MQGADLAAFGQGRQDFHDHSVLAHPFHHGGEAVFRAGRRVHAAVAAFRRARFDHYPGGLHAGVDQLAFLQSQAAVTLIRDQGRHAQAAGGAQNGLHQQAGLAQRNDPPLKHVPGAGFHGSLPLQLFTQQTLRLLRIAAHNAALAGSGAPSQKNVHHRQGQALAAQFQGSAVAQAARAEQALGQAAGRAALLQAAPHVTGVATHQFRTGRKQARIFQHPAQATAHGQGQRHLAAAGTLHADDPPLQIHIRRT